MREALYSPRLRNLCHQTEQLRTNVEILAS